MSVETSDLRTLGHQARAKYNLDGILGSNVLSGKNLYGQCTKVAKNLAQKIVDMYDIPEDRVWVQKCRMPSGEAHRVVCIEGDVIEDVNSSSGDVVLLDATLDQFCVEQEELERVKFSVGVYDEISKVAIIEEDDPKRSLYEF